MIWILILAVIINPVLSCNLDEYINDEGCQKCVEGLYCYNNTAKLCKAGFYCPDIFSQLPCKKSNFCLEGSIQQIPCVLGWLTCPNDKMIEPMPFIGGIFYSFTLFVLINLIFLISFYYKNKKDNAYPDINLRDKFKLLIPYIRRWINFKRRNTIIDINEEIKIIECQKLLLKISKRVILEKITGFFISGKINVILGESGSGKSSLMNILIGKKFMILI